MDLSRIEGTFKCPDEVISIIGCGAIGSQVAVQLVKLGCTKFNLYDFDIVEEHNFVNQAFTLDHLGSNKAEALSSILGTINPNIEVTVFNSTPDMMLKYEEQLEGYVFLATDTPSSRKHCLTKNKTNPAVLGWFDCRTELFAVQVFASRHEADGINALLDTLSFTDEEAEAALPRAQSGCRSKQACGITSAIGAATMSKLFVDLINKGEVRTFTRVDLDNYNIESYKTI